MDSRKNTTTAIAIAGSIALVLVLVIGTIWSSHRARLDTESAVRSVSLLYLDELAGRREQVVAGNMQEKINVINTALELMTEDDLSDLDHLHPVSEAEFDRIWAYMTDVQVIHYTPFSEYRPSP